jgi:tetratricopeptide (TPR) repeat protein
VARDLARLAEVLEEQGRFTEADDAYAQAVHIFEDSSDKRSLAEARFRRVDLLLADSRFREAKAELDATRTLAQEVGETFSTTVVSARMSWVLSRMSDEPGAARERVRARQPLSDLPPDVTMWRVDELGMAFVELGDLQAATQCFEASRDIARRSKNPLDVSFSEQRMATVLHRQGRLNEAKELLERAIVTQTRLKSMGNAVDSRFQLASVLADQGDLETARKLHAENVDTAKRLGMDRRAAYGELDRFDVSLAAGKTIANPNRVAEIAEAFREEELVYGESYALYVGAREARLRGDLPRARESIEKAKELAERILIRNYWNAWHLGHDLRRLVRLEAAQIQGLTGNLATSLGEIEAIEAEAQGLNHLPLLLRARLVRAELQSGEAEGRLELERVEREANEKGFLVILDRARAIRLGRVPSR